MVGMDGQAGLKTGARWTVAGCWYWVNLRYMRKRRGTLRRMWGKRGEKRTWVGDNWVPDGWLKD